MGVRSSDLAMRVPNGSSGHEEHWFRAGDGRYWWFFTGEWWIYDGELDQWQSQVTHEVWRGVIPDQDEERYARNDRRRAALVRSAGIWNNRFDIWQLITADGAVWPAPEQSSSHFAG